MTVTETGGRRPPHNLQAEESLLGGMLNYQETIAVGAERLQASDFYKPAHGHIFNTIVALNDSGEPAGVIAVADDLERASLLDKIGGVATLVTLQGNGCARASAARHAKIIQSHSLLRRMIGVAGEISELAYDMPDDVATAIDKAQTLVFDLGARTAGRTSRTLAEVIESTLDMIEERAEAGTELAGLPTGLRDLDDILRGLRKSAVYIVGARPSAGKTALALTMAQNACAETKAPTLIFSMEMSDVELGGRMLSSEARIDSRRIQSADLDGDHWKKVTGATGRLADLPIWVNDDPSLTINRIRSEARRIKAKARDLGLIVIDYAQLMTGRAGAESRQVEVSEISRGLKLLARELDVAVVVLSQLSRQLELRADKRPMLADLRESGSLEQDADVVMFIYRDDMYRTDSPDAGTAEIIVAKHRNGATGTARVAWLPHFTKFANLARSA